MANPITWLGTKLDGLFGVDGDREKADAAKQSLQDAIASGGLQASAQFGQQGQTLHNQADALAKQNVGLDWNKVDADNAQLAAVRQHYQDQFRDGGLAGAAAVQAAQSARGLTAHGGVAGIRQDTLGSANAQAQVAQTAQGEMGDAGDAANSLDQQKAAMALQKAVLQAQVTHQNFTKNLATQAVNFGLTNTQQQLANQAQAAANQLAYQQGNTSLDYGQQQYNFGKQLTDFATSALAKGAATASSIGSDLAQPVASGSFAAAPADVVASPTASGAGYVQPAVAMGRSVAANPIFATQPTLPTSSDFFNRGP